MGAERVVARAVEEGLPLLRAAEQEIAGSKLATEVYQSSRPAAAALVEPAEAIFKGSGKMEVPAFAGNGGDLGSSNEMTEKYVAMSRPAFVYGRGAPAIVSRSFDSADPLGRVITGRSDTVALVANIDRSGDYTRSSGLVVRPDGLVLTALHPLESIRGGDIRVRILGEPNTFRARILDQSKAEDLALLKPTTVLVGHARPFVPTVEFQSRTPTGSQLVNMGVQDVSLSAANHLDGRVHISEGKVHGLDPVRFYGEPPTERYRTNVTGEYGQSGGPVYDIGTRKLAGIMLGGNDYKWSGIAPASKARALVDRNWTR